MHDLRSDAGCESFLMWLPVDMQDACEQSGLIGFGVSVATWSAATNGSRRSNLQVRYERGDQNRIVTKLKDGTALRFPKPSDRISLLRGRYAILGTGRVYSVIGPRKQRNKAGFLVR